MFQSLRWNWVGHGSEVKAVGKETGRVGAGREEGGGICQKEGVG